MAIDTSDQPNMQWAALPFREQSPGLTLQLLLGQVRSFRQYKQAKLALVMQYAGENFQKPFDRFALGAMTATTAPIYAEDSLPLAKSGAEKRKAENEPEITAT